MNRLLARSRGSLKEGLRRLDRVAGDLNVVLLLIAIGLAMVDTTMLLTQKAIDHLPPITRVSHAPAPPSAD